MTQFIRAVVVMSVAAMLAACGGSDNAAVAPPAANPGGGGGGGGAGGGGSGGGTQPPAATAPVITAQPASTVATDGSTVTFMVTATGATSYQWQRNAAPISGATGPSYTTPAITLADNGAQYRVVVTNANGSVTSNVATLGVAPKATAAPDIVRLAFLSFDALELAFASLLVPDDNNNVIRPSMQVCAAGGSVAATLNGNPAIGQTAPNSGTLAATFTDCQPFTGTTYNGASSVQYDFTATDWANGTATGTMTNMRVIDRDNTTVTRNVTGNGSVQATVSTQTAVGVITETTTFAIASGSTLASALSGLTATFTGGNYTFVNRQLQAGNVPQSVAYTANNVTYTIGAVTYASSGTLNFDLTNITGGTGQINVTANGANVGRVFFNSAGILSVESNGVVVPF